MLDKKLKMLLENVSSKLEKYVTNSIEKLFIIADEETSFFCCESLPMFSDTLIYRIPSFEYFKCVDYKNRRVKLNKITYILDPDNNLQNTKEKFTKFLTRNDNTRGITSKTPSVNDLKHVFNSSLFLYFGHGTGEKNICQTIIIR